MGIKGILQEERRIRSSLRSMFKFFDQAVGIDYGKLIIVLFVAFSFSFVFTQFAVGYTLDSAEGEWTITADEPDCVWGDHTSQISWDGQDREFVCDEWGMGCESGHWEYDCVDDQNSGYSFEGPSGSQSLGPGEEFLLGTFTHHNWPISDAPTELELTVTLYFSDPAGIEETFTFTFDHDETPNSGGGCCDDIVSFPTNYGDREFQIGDVLYTLEIVGFIDSYPNGTLVQKFYTAEEADNVAYLVGRLSSVLVGEPDISVNKYTSDDNSNWQDTDTSQGPTIPVGQPVYWRYLVQNTGNMILENVTVDDDQEGTISGPSQVITENGDPGVFDPGDVWEYTYRGTASAGQYENEVTVEGDYGGGTYSDSDPSHYYGNPCPSYIINFLGSSYGSTNTTFEYEIKALNPPGVSHWVLQLLSCVTEDDIVSVSPGIWEFGGPFHGVSGLKIESFGDIDAGETKTFTIVLQGYWGERSAEAVIKAGSEYICHKNTTGPDCPPTYTVTVEKSLSPADPDETFDLLINEIVEADGVSDGGSGESTGIPVGSTVTVSELGDAADLANYNSSLSCDGVNLTNNTGTSGEFTMPDGSVTCTFTNERKTGDIKFVKEVVGGDAQPSEWTFDVAGPETVNGIAHNGTETLDTGTYTVTESSPNDEDYNLTGASGICSLSGDTVTMEVTESGGTCTITNTRKTGSIEIVKTTVGGDATFGYTISGGPTGALPNVTTTSGSGSTTVAVETGSGYTVTESTIPEGWTLTSSECGTAFDVAEDQTVTCEFENHKEKARIELTPSTATNGVGQQHTVTASV